MDHIDDFIRALQSRGLMVDHGDVIPDGEIHRCKVITDKGHARRNGWFILYDGSRQAGAFGRHDDGLGKEVWVSDKDPTISEAERRERDREWKERIAAAKVKRLARQRHAAALAATMWAEASPVVSHPYLTRKKVQSHGLARLGKDLLVPIRNGRGVLMSVEKISPDGSKWYLKHGCKAGGYHAIGGGTKKQMPAILIVEGYATAATLHECTGLPVAVAFDCENLLAVAEILRKKYRKVPIVLCADDDWKTNNNPGVLKAREAADAVGGHVAIPLFPKGKREDKDTDFNDLARQAGKAVVKDIVMRSIQSDTAGSKTKGG